MVQAWDFVDSSVLWQSRNEFLSMRVQQIDWGNQNFRIRNAMLFEGIETVADLVSRTKYELMRVPNFGQKSLDSIKAVLNQHGLEFSTPHRFP